MGRWIGVGLLMLTVCGALAPLGMSAHTAPRPAATQPVRVPHVERALGPQPASTPRPTSTPDPGARLNAIKAFMVRTTAHLVPLAVALKRAADDYYALAAAARFDYTRLWRERHAQALAALDRARAAWSSSVHTYAGMQSIVGGVPTTGLTDWIINTGTAASAGGYLIAPYDLHLPDGRVLRDPGNLLDVLELTLWGTSALYVVPHVTIDAGKAGGFGQAVPDANLLKAAGDAFAHYVTLLLSQARAWQPMMIDVYHALIISVSGMGDVISAWKRSRYVLGARSKEADFAARSALATLRDTISGWQVLYGGLGSVVQQKDRARDRLITKGLDGLYGLVASLSAREAAGHRFSPAAADLIGAEIQDRITALVGQVTQVGTELRILINTCSY